jgi:hypothetical protein
MYGETLENGIRIVKWEEVKSEVEKVLNDHKKANI